jgi:hypothetical protein
LQATSDYYTLLVDKTQGISYLPYKDPKRRNLAMTKRRGNRIGIETRLVKMPQLLMELANLREDRVTEFKKTWGFTRYNNAQILDKRDQLRLLWLDCLHLNLPSIGAKHEELLHKEANLSIEIYPWQPEDGVVVEPESIPEQMCEAWLQEEQVGWNVDWPGRRIFPSHWHLPVILAVGCIDLSEHFAYCWNPDCSAPYFISRRNDQRYCSDQCAWPAKKAAKRKWKARQGRKLSFGVVRKQSKSQEEGS